MKTRFSEGDALLHNGRVCHHNAGHGRKRYRTFSPGTRVMEKTTGRRVIEKTGVAIHRDDYTAKEWQLAGYPDFLPFHCVAFDMATTPPTLVCDDYPSNHDEYNCLFWGCLHDNGCIPHGFIDLLGNLRKSSGDLVMKGGAA